VVIKKYILTSFIICFLIAISLIAFSFPCNSCPTKDFNLVVYTAIISIASLGGIVLTLIHKSIYSVNSALHFGSILSGTANLLLGFIGSFLFTTNKLTETPYIFMFTLNLILGVLVYFNLYRTIKKRTT
jgi:hypothetical protein